MEQGGCILGCAGKTLSELERGFFRAAAPFGFILFARNIDSPDQVRALVDDLRDCVGRRAPILIDQEGGRVQRLGPPHWRRYPPGRAYGEHADGEALARLGARLIAHDLFALGIDVDCLPVLDVPVQGAHDIIGDRAYAKSPARVAAFGAAACAGLLAGGVLPVIKHIPGHGRAFADSHEALPLVETSLDDLRAHDFPPFKALAGMPMAMTAHVVYAALDPQRPATTSPTVIEAIIRGELGFDGLLMSDDLSMKALSGDFGDRTRDSLAAGCDVVLHCNGVMSEMEPIVAACGLLQGEALRRAEDALAQRQDPDDFDPEWSRAQLDAAFDGRFAGMSEAELDIAAIEADEILLIDIDGYEGPLHLLLMLARKQKVDLLSLSITRLADQYLAFIHEAKRLRFSLAADYLVMAAYLAYLKSRLLLPKPARAAGEEPEPEEAAAQLSFRLAKLEAMRQAAEAFKTLPRLGHEVFGRGDPEAVKILPSGRIEGDLYGLMSAYIGQRRREQARSYRPSLPTAYPLEEARERLREMLPQLRAWTSLERAAPLDEVEEGGPSRASYLASTLSASLELVKEGALETRQLRAFEALFLRARAAA